MGVIYIDGVAVSTTTGDKIPTKKSNVASETASTYQKINTPKTGYVPITPPVVLEAGSKEFVELAALLAADDEKTAVRTSVNAAEQLYDADKELDNLLDQLAALDSASPEGEAERLEAAIAEQQIEVAALSAAVDAADEAEVDAAAATNAANIAEAEVAAKTQLEASFDGKLEGAAGRKRLLAAQQCFLLYNNHFFVKEHKRLLSGTSLAYAPGSSSTKGTRTVEDWPSYNYHSGKKLKNGINTSPGYYSKETNSTKIILVDDTVQTNDSTVINRIKAKNKQEEFDTITPAEYAQLLPRLRLFKLNYIEGDSKKGAFEKQEAIEFEFTSRIDVSDISAVGRTFEGNIKGDGAGVKSFEWSYLGSDAFTATRDLKATLKLNFQSFNELQKPRTSGGKEYRYLDLVIQADCGDRDKDNQVIYDPGCYEILAEVGYSVPSNNTLSTDSKRNESLLEAVRSSVEHLYLVMTDHSFEFEQDGTFSLTINYRARLGSQLGSRQLNVLLPGGGGDGTFAQNHIDRLKEEKASLKEREKSEAGDEEGVEPDPPKTPGIMDSLFGGDEELTDSEEKQKELDDYVAKQRMRFYNAIYSSLRNRKWIHGVHISEEDEIKYLNYDQKIIKPVAGTAGVEQFIGLPDPLPDTTITFYDFDSNVNSYDEMYATVDGTTTTVITGDQSKSAGTQATAKQDDQLERLKKQLERGNTEPVRFVYLGDIIACVRDWVMAEDEFALTDLYKATATDKLAGYGDRLGKGGKGDGRAYALSVPEQLKRTRETFQIILGNVNIKDFQSKETRMVNMAHIPISLEAFLNFMTTKVVAKKRKVYEFSKFLNDLISDLVMQNLSNRCFGGLVVSNVRTSMSMIEVPGIDGKEPIAGGGSVIWKKTKSGNSKYRVFQVDKLSTGNSPYFVSKTPPVTKSGAPLNKSFDYLLINSVSSKPKLYGVFDKEAFKEKNGQDTQDPLDDKTRGIPHYAFGQNKGILKTVKFQKTDQEYLPEAKYEQEGSSAINQLAAVYDVTFEMLGTSRFQPGQYIYFDPVTMGVGHPWQSKKGSTARSYANLMGLGGYHLVIEVSCNIQRGEFVTTLKTRWTTSGCHPISGC